ncbi:glycosyltransferase family 9 protein [candidate division KSB1 bacterium]|nr:glycosyltransferase family 9 protein [candidate division KSB1 bacterium]RQW05733.1 MAG: glycosyltransferase family 9 protein [candidate division KSB1 bacterium]
MILPAVLAIRRFFPDAEFSLYSGKELRARRVTARQVFENSGYFDRFVFFPKSKKISAFFQALALFMSIPRLKLMKFDTLVYLVPSNRSVQQIERDRKIFKLAGIHHFIGMDGFYQQADAPRHEADRLLARLAHDGVEIPAVGKAKFQLNLSEQEKRAADDWLVSQLQNEKNRLFVAFAPGSNMQSKRWGIANFSAIGKKLIEKYDIIPVIFGATEDADIGRLLIKSWKRGINAAGSLSVRQAAVALSRCSFFIGNDTGTMHLAAAMHVRCVAIFSARDEEEKWYPYGTGHIVFREHIACQGCMRDSCDHKTCLTRISPLRVFRRVEKEFQDILQSR